MHIKKNDTVTILQGKDSGKTGKVIRVMAKKRMAIVENINLVKRHIKRQNQQQPGGIVQVEKPLHISKLKKVDDLKPSKSTKTKSTAKKAK